ncbi:hypothetical protein [Parvularcula oceani]|uniref:hypothetical protein n=1 Tax=Parvularcula oceani TaxID=1247963 RepID=UPI0012DD5402|nr:hypothetical protein [Parvularcula oceani]
MNLYAYVGNDPVNATDPDGMSRIREMRRRRHERAVKKLERQLRKEMGSDASKYDFVTELSVSVSVKGVPVRRNIDLAVIPKDREHLSDARFYEVKGRATKS